MLDAVIYRRDNLIMETRNGRVENEVRAMKIRLQNACSYDGSFSDSNDRSESFLTMCEAFQKMTRDEIMAKLAAGEVLKYDCDWYAKIRCGNIADAKRAATMAARPVPVMVRCDCGCTVEKSLVMNASTGTACPDCYDRMS